MEVLQILTVVLGENGTMQIIQIQTMQVVDGIGPLISPMALVIMSSIALVTCLAHQMRALQIMQTQDVIKMLQHYL